MLQNISEYITKGTGFAKSEGGKRVCGRRSYSLLFNPESVSSLLYVPHGSHCALNFSQSWKLDWIFCCLFQSAQKIFGGEVKNHLLLFVSKDSDKFAATLEDYKKAAVTFKAKVWADYYWWSCSHLMKYNLNYQDILIMWTY